MIDIHRRERVYETLDSPAWAAVLEMLYVQVRAWNRDLLTNAKLDDGERRGLVRARTALLEGISSLYTKAGRELPPDWARESFSYSD